MKRFLFVAVAYAALVGNARWIRGFEGDAPPQFHTTACSFVRFAADDNIRMEQLLYQSEDFGLHPERFSTSNTRMPSHLTAQRVHGGITP